MQALESAGAEREAALEACYRRLNVADQRGFCIGEGLVGTCPLAQPSYRDACEQLNDAEARAGCS